jgi:hypothetical protein
LTLNTRLAASVLSLGLIALAAPINTRAQAEDVIADTESYVVFAAALTIASAQDRRPAERVALLEETRPVTTCPAEESVPPEWRSALANHKRNNVRTRTLRSDADFGRPHTLVSMVVLRSLMRTAGYDLSRFSGQQSPGGGVFRGLPGGKLIAFSAVGFDEQKTRAVVTVQYDCFPTAENQPPTSYCHEFRQLMLVKHAGQ